MELQAVVQPAPVPLYKLSDMPRVVSPSSSCVSVPIDVKQYDGGLLTGRIITRSPPVASAPADVACACRTMPSAATNAKTTTDDRLTGPRLPPVNKGSRTLTLARPARCDRHAVADAGL